MHTIALFVCNPVHTYQGVSAIEQTVGISELTWADHCFAKICESRERKIAMIYFHWWKQMEPLMMSSSGALSSSALENKWYYIDLLINDPQTVDSIIDTEGNKLMQQLKKRTKHYKHSNTMFVSYSEERAQGFGQCNLNCKYKDKACQLTFRGTCCAGSKSCK